MTQKIKYVWGESLKDKNNPKENWAIRDCFEISLTGVEIAVLFAVWQTYKNQVKANTESINRRFLFKQNIRFPGENKPKLRKINSSYVAMPDEPFFRLKEVFNSEQINPSFRPKVDLKLYNNYAQSLEEKIFRIPRKEGILILNGLLFSTTYGGARSKDVVQIEDIQDKHDGVHIFNAIINEEFVTEEEEIIVSGYKDHQRDFLKKVQEIVLDLLTKNHPSYNTWKNKYTIKQVSEEIFEAYGLLMNCFPDEAELRKDEELEKAKKAIEAKENDEDSDNMWE